MSLGLRTVNPEEADYFFLPGCGRGCNKWDQKFKYIMVRQRGLGLWGRGQVPC